MIPNPHGSKREIEWLFDGSGDDALARDLNSEHAEPGLRMRQRMSLRQRDDWVANELAPKRRLGSEWAYVPEAANELTSLNAKRQLRRRTKLSPRMEIDAATNERISQ